jgi:alkyl sulfatase BDS1-like metallo-beta-lactamase superfamily hydrolase
MMEYAGWVHQSYGELPEQDVPGPDILFDEKHSLVLGGIKLELIAVPGAETNDSLIVWLPEQRIVFTGNLFGCPWGHFPNLVTIRGDRYRDALTCAAAVKTVMDLEPEIVCYGHHEPIRGRDVIREELQRLHGAIMYVHDAVVEGMNAGTDVYTLQKTIELPLELEVGQGYGKVSWGVKAIWEHYGGWFHHESTTELYSEPASAVHADLIELAGTEKIIARAREKISQGELVQAQQLLDIVLSQQNNAEAIAAAIDVHQQLLQDSVNFWLSHWLEQQIKLLQAKA